MALLVGTPGNDILTGTPQADEIQGLGGDDILSGEEGDDLLLGGAGDDTLRGGAGNDRLEGGAGINTLEGGEGDDTLLLGDGGHADGGAGRDRIVSSGRATSVDLGAGIVRGYDSSTGQMVQIGTVTGVEDASGFTTTIGSDADNVLIGGSLIQGLGGNDWLEVSVTSIIAASPPEEPAAIVEGGAGDDTVLYHRGDLYGRFVYDVAALLDGGEGNDTLAFGRWTSQRDYYRTGVERLFGVEADLAAGTARRAGGGYPVDTVLNFENLTGTDQGDSLSGDAGANRLDGGAGDDRLKGGGGDDTLTGGEGFDWLLLAGATDATFVDLAAGTAQDGLGGTDTLSGFEAVLGSDQADTILGSDGAETLWGEAGDDILRGGGGDDTLRGGAGDDLLDGGAGFDTVQMDGLTFYGSQRALSPEGQLRLTTAEGTDTLVAVEEVRFLDGRLAFVDAETPEGAVLRLYALALGRAPDEGGLAFWAAGLKAGEALGTVAEGILDSAEFAALHGNPADDSGFVQMLYTSVFGRPADAEGAAWWTEQLAAGASRGSVLAAFSESAENRALTADDATLGIWWLDQDAAVAARLYDALLDRAPDAGGLAFMTATVRDLGAATGAATILASAEFAEGAGDLTDSSFVSFLYSTALNRPVEQEGLAYWTSQLAAGLTRAELAVAISEGAEHVAITRPSIEDGILLS